MRVPLTGCGSAGENGREPGGGNVVSNFTRGGLVALVAASALAWPGAVLADAPPVGTRAPEIQGKPIVGQTLQAVGGAWSGSADAAENYAWRRCSDADFEDCSTISGATGVQYTLTSADVGYMMLVTLSVTLGDDSSYKNSDMTTVVKAADGSAPVPQPIFTSTAPVNVGPVAAFPAGAKFLKPRRVISIRGKY